MEHAEVWRARKMRKSTQFWLYNGKRYLISLSSSDIEKMIQLSAISELKVKCIECSPNFQVLHISMNAQLTYKPIVLWHFQPDGLNVVNGLIFPLLRFSALIILFQESISLRCKRSCLRLVKKLTGEFMRVNELYFLIEYKILKGFVCWRHERAQFNK